MELKIYNRKGVLKLTVSPSDNSTRQKRLMSDHVLSLSFTAFRCVPLEVYDYVDFEGARFWVMEEYAPAETSTVEWEYDVKLYGVESLIKQALVLKLADGENNPIFSLTAPAREHMALIVANINRQMGTTDWKVGEVLATENLTIDYEGTYCDEALSMLADAAKTEFWADGMTINLCRCEYGDEVVLGHSNGLVSLERTAADNIKFFTRLFPIGSTRNIDPEEYGYSRLQLPSRLPYVERNTQRGVVEHYERDAFSGIYPRRVGTISGVRSEQHTGENGKPFTIYYVKDADLTFDPNSYEIGSLVKQMTFQGGELNGRDFEVNYDTKKKEFEIITQWPYDDDTQLPGGLLIPKVGDEYILWNIRMPEEYYALAEQEFAEAVDAYIQEHDQDRYVYKGHTDYIDIAQRQLVLDIGQRVRLESDEYFPGAGYRTSRITSISQSVQYPSDMDIEVSDVLGKGALDKINDELGEVRQYAKTASAGIPDIVRSWENTPPSDFNLFSAKRSLKEFLDKRTPDAAQALISFLEGIHVGNYVRGGAGAGIDADGNAEVESLRVRSFMEVYELIYNRLNALEGNTSFADVGTIDSIEQNTDGTCTLVMRKRWTGDITAFQWGDVVYGYVNDLNASGGYYKCWLRITDVDTVANALTAIQYADADVPAGVNFPPTANMVITRWGNAIEPTAESHAAYPSVIHQSNGSYVNVRRDAFYISCEDGNLVQLMGVCRPKIDRTNYGTVLGKIPAGLLDAALPVNEHQPYLYARGIVVQDLIRIGYEGCIIRTENYRGQWSAATAASETEGYRSTDTVYDTVTHAGVLWQCAASGTLDEPSDNTGSWVRMSGKDKEVSVEIWQIIPSTNAISLRKDRIEPALVTCAVEKRSTEGDATYTTSYDLAQAGYKLCYSLDGGEMVDFVIGSDEPLETESGEEIEIETSSSNTELFLTLGGDDVDTSRIGDRIIFYLVRSDTGEIETQTAVPVVKDGVGEQGVQGRLIYPAGIFDEKTTYVCTAEKAPAVYYGEKYYVMVKTGSYQGVTTPHKDPASDAAYNTEPYWSLMSDFAAVFAEILFANFAKLGSAVFYGDYMFSQNGTLNGWEVSGTDKSGIAYYKQFKDGVTAGTFIPNLMLNLLTGEVIANKATIKGTIDATSGRIGGFKIGNGYIGVDANLGENGGSEGMSLFPEFIKFANSDWSQVAMIGTNVLPGSLGYPAMAQFINKNNEVLGTNYGVLVSVSGGAYNIALAAKGNIVSDGLVSSYQVKTITLDTNTVTHATFDSPVWLIKCKTSDSHIALPGKFDVQRQLGLGTNAPFSVRITIIGDASSTVIFKVQGRNTSIHDSNSYFLNNDQYPYRLDNNARQQLTDGLSMGAGDIAEFQLVFDGTTYNAYYLNNRI